MGSLGVNLERWPCLVPIEGLEETLNILQLKWILFTPASIPPLNRVKRGQPVNIAIFGINIALFGIKLKVLMRTLRNYDFTDILKWVILTLTPSGVTWCQF